MTAAVQFSRLDLHGCGEAHLTWGFAPTPLSWSEEQRRNSPRSVPGKKKL